MKVGDHMSSAFPIQSEPHFKCRRLSTFTSIQFFPLPTHAMPGNSVFVHRWFKSCPATGDPILNCQKLVKLTDHGAVVSGLSIHFPALLLFPSKFFFSVHTIMGKFNKEGITT